MQRFQATFSYGYQSVEVFTKQLLHPVKIEEGLEEAECEKKAEGPKRPHLDPSYFELLICKWLKNIHPLLLLQPYTRKTPVPKTKINFTEAP